MYTVLGSTRNRTLRVIWTLEELGVPYNQISGTPGSQDTKAYSKTGKVPALILDGKVFTDSIAIIYFLSDLHNSLTFPTGSLDRLRMDGHINFLLEEFDSLLWVWGETVGNGTKAAKTEPVRLTYVRTYVHTYVHTYVRM